jgi:hypothetical protein
LKDIVYIVKEIVESMDNTVNVSSFVGNDLVTCGLKWARVGMTVTDSGDNEYIVTAINHEARTMTVDGGTFSGTTIALKMPLFSSGTPIATNTEWKAFDRDERNKLPFAWLVEPTREKFKGEQDTLERESDILMVFLDSNNVTKWFTIDTHDNRLQSLYNMVDAFIQAIKENPLFYSDLLEFDTKNFTKFGKETSKGMEANIIDANLTGVELRLTLPINRAENCYC